MTDVLHLINYVASLTVWYSHIRGGCSPSVGPNDTITRYNNYSINGYMLLTNEVEVLIERYRTLVFACLLR